MSITRYSEGGMFEPKKIASILRTTSEEVALTVGFAKDALQRRTRIQSDRTQRRLRELVEILNKVQPRFGSELMAYAWYRSEPLPGSRGVAARHPQPCSSSRATADDPPQQASRWLARGDAGALSPLPGSG